MAGESIENETFQYAEEVEEDFGFSSLSDEALLMADELMKKQYALPDLINEQTIRAAYKRA